MLAIQKQKKYIQKAVQLPNGAWGIVVFELIEVNGHIIAKAVSGKLLEDINTEQTEIVCLPCIKSPKEFAPIKSSFVDFLSNFSKDFSFMTCSIARAPNFC